MENVKVSVIIPVYNAEKYIKRCIDSLLNQTLKDIEIILVDDASKDNTSEILDREAEIHPQIKVIHKQNEGAGLSRNAGLSVARGEYIGFVDSDDYVEPDMFETLYNKAVEYESDLVISGVVFVGGNVFKETGEKSYKIYFDKDTHFTTKEELKELRLGIAGARPGEPDDSKYGMSVWKNLFKRDIIEKNNLKFLSERETLSEDALFMIDYIACIKKATGISGAFYNYCRNEESISKSYKKDRFEKGYVFISELEKRFGKDASPEEYRVYLDRFVLSFARFVCSQEIMYATDKKIPYRELKNRLKNICTSPAVERALKEYPIFSLPVKQAVFAYAMKKKMYFIQKLVVGLRR